MPKPTPEQLEQINRFTLVPLTAENCYVFSDLMIDDQRTAYFSKIHENLLTKFIQDAGRGVGLLMNHNSRSLPVGRSFHADLRTEQEGDSLVKSVYGNFYVDLGRNTESGMSTDDITKGIDAGTIFDTSIGFNATSWECSICSHDIRDWNNCSHFPGEKYQVKGENGVNQEITCEVIAGKDGSGELLENSLVYAGACNRATIKQNFSANSVSDLSEGSKLHLVDDFKTIPLNATIFQYFTKDGSVLYTDTPERTNGVEELRKRSEQQVKFEELMAVLGQFDIKVESPEQLTAKLTEMNTALSETKAQNDQLTNELATTATELEDVKGKLSTSEATVSELTQVNEELASKAELANTYRQDLTVKAVELGVRAQGNAFKAELFEKFLATLSIDEIKEVISGFEAEVQTRFDGARVSAPNANTRSSAEPKSRDDFETEEEFRSHVADEAVKYSKEHNVSLRDATKLVYEKFTKVGSEA